MLITAGGWLYVKIPRHTWVDGVPGLRSLRGAHHHVALGLVLAVAGLGLLTWSWWQLRAVVKGRSDGVVRVRWAAAERTHVQQREARSPGRLWTHPKTPEMFDGF